MWTNNFSYHQETTMRTLVFTSILFFVLSATGFSSDSIPGSTPKKDNQVQKERFIIRGGIGAQGMFSLVYPSDINAYTKDLYGSIMKSYASFNSGNEPKEMHWGYGYSLKAEIRALNLFQIEPYWDQFYTFPLEVLFK
jgi:hypothetical protein